MLTTAQYATLKADILANADMNTQPAGSTGNAAILALYNAASTTDVWRTEVPASLIYDGIDWSKFTPIDAVPAINSLSGNGELHQYNGRLLMIQTKQMNLQNMLQGRETVNSSKANIRAGLRDAVIALPAGTNGANVAAGGASGVTVLTACLRKANRFEKLFATASATTGTITANLLVLEGQLSSDDLQIARES